ncbi:hypothetical protein FRC11_003329, partial [Ceratobasidium sp. 423]
KRRKLMPVSTQWEHLEASFAQDGMGNRSESGAPADTNNNKSKNEMILSRGLKDKISRADSSESEESEGKEYWEEAFNFEFEFGEEALNVFGDMNLSNKEEVFEYDELDNDNNGFIE